MLLRVQLVHESRWFLESRLLLKSRWFLQIGETIDHMYRYEMHPICSLQRHDRLTKGVAITQALRCQVDTWLMGALREKSFGWNCRVRGYRFTMAVDDWTACISLQ